MLTQILKIHQLNVLNTACSSFISDKRKGHYSWEACVHVHIYSLYLGQTALRLSTEFIVSFLNISNSYFLQIKRHYISRTGFVHDFIFYRKWNKTAWTLGNRTVCRAQGSFTNTERLKAGIRRWTGPFVRRFIKRVSAEHQLYAIFYNHTLNNLKSFSYLI